MMEAVLFDFDGVLAKTMEDNFEAWRNSFKLEGIEISKEDYFLLEGASLREIARIISEKHNVKLDLDKIILKKEEYFKKNHTFSFYSGVLELIEKLNSKNVKIAIVTAAHRERLFSTTPKYFLEKFDSIVTGDDFEIGKPHPDPYLTAANNLGINIKNCVVVENAPYGIKSAKAAGMYCIAVSSTLSKSHLSEADITIDSFEDLNNLKIFKTYFL